MTDLKKVLTCNYCNFIYESPVILPCAETMCEKHVEELKKRNSQVEKINCVFCKEEHLTPKNGFPKDKSMIKLMNLELHIVDVSHKRAVDCCHNLYEMIEKLENLTQKPESFINEYFDEMTAKIDLTRDENRIKLEKCHENNIKDIDVYKKECLTQLKNLESWKSLNSEKDIIKNSKKDLEVWQKKITSPESNKNDFTFENIEKNVNNRVEIIKKTIDDLKENLLICREFTFENKNISSEDFGILKVDFKVFFNFY